MKAVIVLRSRKEVDNEVSDKEHDKDERLKTIENDLEIEKENDPSLAPLCLNPPVTYKLRVPHPQTLNASFPSKKDKQRDDIFETFKQDKVNLPLLEEIR